MALPSIARIDRRILYVILLLGVTIPLLSPLKLPIPISPHTRGVYDVTEALSAGDVAILTFDFGPATLPENRPQAKAYAFHCKQKGIKVIGIAFWPSGAVIGEEVLREVYGFATLPGPNDALPDGLYYGVDVVFIGFHPGGAVGISAFGDNTWFTVAVDAFGNSFTNLPLMNEVRSAADFDIWMEVMSGTPGIDAVVMYIYQVHGVTLVTAGTAVTIPGAMPYYNAAQVVGLLNGLAGAGEYESLLNLDYDYPYEQGPSLDAQSVAHVLIIVFIIIGNIGFAYSKLGGEKTR